MTKAKALFHYRVKVRIVPWGEPAFDVHVGAVASNAHDALSFAEQQVRRGHQDARDVGGIDSRRIKAKS